MNKLKTFMHFLQCLNGCGLLGYHFVVAYYFSYFKIPYNTESSNKLKPVVLLCLKQTHILIKVFLVGAPYA